MDLPGFGSTPDGVPCVEPDEVVANEGDGEQHAGGDQPGLPEEPPVDTQPLEAVGAEQALDQAATIERERPAGGLPRMVLPIALVVGVLDGDGLAASARLTFDTGGGGDCVRLPYRSRGGD